MMLSGAVLPLLLGFLSLPALDVHAKEGTTMVHRGAFSHQLSLVGSDASLEQLALTDEDVLYLGVTVDDGEPGAAEFPACIISSEVCAKKTDECSELTAVCQARFMRQVPRPQRKGELQKSISRHWMKYGNYQT